MLPPGTQNVRLPIWSPPADRFKLSQLARYAEEFGVINTLPNLTQLVPTIIPGGKIVQGVFSSRRILLRLDGVGLARLSPGEYTFVVNDSSKALAFMLVGPGVKKQTSLRGSGQFTWQLTLKKGTYIISSSNGSLKKTFVVS